MFDGVKKEKIKNKKLKVKNSIARIKTNRTPFFFFITYPIGFSPAPL